MDKDTFENVQGTVLKEDAESDEEIEVTAAEVLEKLEEAWINEKFAPELLESKSDLVECMVEQIKSMEENLQSVKKGDLVGVLHKLECRGLMLLVIQEMNKDFSTEDEIHVPKQIDRVRYVLSSFLRTRLQKIEKNVIHILEQEATRDANEPARLSTEEFQYAKEFADNMEGLFKTLCLQHMPPNMQSIDHKKSVPRPDLDSYIFLTILEEQNQVMVDPEEDPVDLEKGAQHIMRYSAIAPLLGNGSVALI